MTDTTIEKEPLDNHAARTKSPTANNRNFNVRTLFKWFLNPKFWIVCFPALLIIPNVLLAITELNSVWAKMTNIALPLGFYLCLMSLSKKVGRSILLFIPIIIFVAFQIVLLALYGESIVAIDMYVNVMTTSVSEASELLGNLWPAIVAVLALYLPPIGAAIVIRYKRIYAPFKFRRNVRFFSYGLMGLGVMFFIFALIFADHFFPRREIFPYNVMENMITAIRRTNESMHYYNTSYNFSYTPSMSRDKDEPEVYVVVIGETSRAENWELFGYNRPTNPKLSSRDGVFKFSKALTEINTTHKAVPMLLSYLEPSNFGDSVAHTKSIFSAYNHLGYRTAFLSNQRRNHSYIDYYGDEAQLSSFISDVGGPVRDFNLIEPMQNVIESSSNNKVFIVLHTYGSHFEYRKRYPGEMAVFTPDVNSNANRFNRSQLLNAYDNTIVYTDALLDSIIGSLDNLHIPAAMIYVSDHGEDIFDDDRERFLHSSPTPTFHQLHVPMIVWLSDEFRQQHPDMERALKANADKNIASTSSLFHTILDLTAVKTPFYDATYSIASPQFVEHERIYLNDYNESIPLRESGLRHYDFELFKKYKINY